MRALHLIDSITEIYGHDTARIGDALDGFQCGVVTALNAEAGAAGLVAGQTVAEAVSLLRTETADGKACTPR
jgi:hypothetical protein